VLASPPVRHSTGDNDVGLLLLPFALIAYFVAIFLSFVGTLGRSALARRGEIALLVLAWLFNLAAIVREARVTGGFPMTNSGQYLLVLGWVVLTMHLVLWFRQRVDVAGLILPPLAALMALGSLLLQARAIPPVPAAHQRGWFLFHTTLATLGTAALCVAFAMSLIYLFQDRALKTKRKLRVLERLPSLDACDRIGFHALLWGFPLLSLGVVTGLVWNWHLHGVVLGNNGPKELFGLLAWGVFGLLLYARLARGFRGRKSAYMTIAGFAFALMVVLGMSR
jgi:ABC-type uncharacterized transport system permease subunit